MRRFILVLFFLFLYESQSQSIHFFDIDNTKFPLMSAKFYATDSDGNLVTNINVSDFDLTENAESKNIIDISCNASQNPQSISSVLAIDVSGSMTKENMFLAKLACTTWIQKLPFNISECAMTAFNEQNSYIQDFTQDKNLLLPKIEDLSTSGGTDFNAAFINQVAGAFIVLEKAQNQKIIILITDGMAEGDGSAIINKALDQDIKIYCITIGNNCPVTLKNIAEQSGGKWFKEVSSPEDVKRVIYNILHSAQEMKPCTIEWESDAKCENLNVKVEVDATNFDRSTFDYELPPSGYAYLDFSPANIAFKDKKLLVQHDTTLTVTAVNSDFNIKDISSSLSQIIITPKSFFLAEGTSKDINISFTPTDSNYVLSDIYFNSTPCSHSYNVAGIYTDIIAKNRTIELLHPNGNEEFLAGSDTVIRWKGLLSTDSVRIQYSTDAGMMWYELTDTAKNFSYIWNLPQVSSKKCLVKISENRNTIEWEKTFGGSGEELAKKVLETDNGYIVLGQTNSQSGDVKSNYGQSDIWITSLDHNGNLLWSKNYGGSQNEDINDIIQTKDKGFVFIGTTDSKDGDITNHKGSTDVWVVKINSAGSIEWQTSYGSFYDESGKSISQSPDGDYVILATARLSAGDIPEKIGKLDAWVAKISPNGVIRWSVCLGGEDDDFAESITVSNDGSILLTGFTYSNDTYIKGNHGQSDVWAAKLSSVGDILWQKCYGGTEGDKGEHIISTLDGGYIIAAHTFSNNGNVSLNHGTSDAWIIKINSSGTIQWEKCFGGSKAEEAHSIIQNKDGQYVVAAHTFSNNLDVNGNHGLVDCWIFKLDIFGRLLWQKNYGGSAEEVASSIHAAEANSLVFAGKTSSNDYDISKNNGKTDFWVAKIVDSDLLIQSDTSDTFFSIVKPEVFSQNMNMGKVPINTSKDSLFINFLTNFGQWSCRIDTIFIEGVDATFFKFNGPLPVYTLPGDSTEVAEFKFSPNLARAYVADVVIISQSDTIRQKIRGIGIDSKLTIVNKDINFGRIPLGETKDSIRVITITNDGTVPIIISKTEHSFPNAVDFKTLKGAGPFTLQPGDTSRMDLSFVANNLGRTSGQLLFYNDASDQPAVINLYAEVYSNNNLDIKNINFPDLLVNSKNDSTVVDYFKNLDQIPITVESVYLKDGDDDQFTIRNLSLPFTLNNGGTKDLNISFVPTSEGNKSTNLYMVSDAGTYKRKITGLSLKRGAMLLTNIIGFGEVDLGDRIDSLNIPILVNTSLQDLNISQISLNGTDELDFEALNGFSVNKLASMDTLFIDLAFFPKTIGIKNASIEVSHDFSENPTSIRVSGYARNVVNPRIYISIPKIETNIGDQINLPIVLDNAINLHRLNAYSLEVKLKFNSTVLHPLDRKSQINANEGMVTIDDINLDKEIGDTLITIPFSTMLGNQELSTVEFGTMTPEDASLKIDTTSGSIQLLNLCEQGGKRLFNPNGETGISTLSPNPAEDKIHIDFSVTEKGFTEISLVNLLGETVATFFAEEIADFQDREINGDVSQLSSGQYILQFKTPTYIEVYQLSIVR